MPKGFAFLRLSFKYTGKIPRRILSARFSVTPDGGRADSRFGQEGFSELARRNLKITVKRLNETALSGKAEFVGDFYYGEIFIHQQVGRMDNFGFNKVFRQGYAVIFFEFSANISVAVRNIRNKIRNGILQIFDVGRSAGKVDNPFRFIITFCKTCEKQ